MAIEVDVSLVRDVLRPYSAAWTDAQISSKAAVLPAQRQLVEWCPNIELTVDEDAIEMAKIALANVIASNLIMSSPRLSSSRLGDSSVNFASTSDEDRVSRLMTQAKELMEDICPGSLKPRMYGAFRLAPGGRGL